ncbi:fungal-specific transcription factor domain-containing protein [Aspergillus sergii]|uniref:Fungal-specific transcription factor domain-containing protein n=1 Tax=Aspergillus sergii TaxID=1034303 RepID=A0A5N6XL67_9EURO|nr:fungal-specific transcription factor domain-containing protein [Aspergillus sergii]
MIDMKRSEGNQPTQSNRANRRSRVALACDICRLRKSRCDGVRPSCSACSRLGFECVYTTPNHTQNVIIQKEYFQALEDRVKSIEETLATMKDDLGGSISSQTSEIEDKRAMNDTNSPVQGIGLSSLIDENEPGFLGPSSNDHFLRCLCHAITQGKDMHIMTTSNLEFYVDFSQTQYPTPASERTQSLEANIFALPPANEMTELVQKFFFEIGILFPFIYPVTFLETYSHLLKNGCLSVSRKWLALLNLIFATVKLSIIPNKQFFTTYIAQSDAFYQRAVDLYGEQVFNGENIEDVQFLLLLGQYLHGRHKPGQAWTVHTLAVKAAFKLGLHSQNALKDMPALAKEARKRTWYGCVMIDRLLSMTLGRPAAIPDCYVKLELPANHECIDTSTIMDNTTADLSVSCLNSTIALYKQLANIIGILFDHNLDTGTTLSINEIISHISSMEDNLCTWQISLPHGLTILSAAGLRDGHQEPMTNAEFFSRKFSVMISLRYYNIRTLLHRPTLASMIETCHHTTDAQGGQTLPLVGLHSLEICTESAIATIDMIYELVHASDWRANLLETWWFSLHYVFNAALVIIGVLWLCKSNYVLGLAMEQLATKTRLYPNRAIAVLSQLVSGDAVTDRGRDILRRLTELLNDPAGQGDVFQDQLTSLQGHESMSEMPNPLSQNSDHSIHNMCFDASTTIEDFLTLSSGTGVLPSDQWQGFTSMQGFDVEGP